MVAGLQFSSILLVFLLIELDYSSAFPRARRPVHPEAWQGLREEQDAYGFGNHQFVQALMQSNQKLQSNDQVNTWSMPQGLSLIDSSQGEMQNQPSLYHQTQSLNQPGSAVSSQPQSQVPMPKSFQFNFQVPMVNTQGQSKENGSSTKETGLNSGGSVGASYNARPSSVHIQSSFNSPSVLDSFLGLKGGRKPHEVAKPSFQLGLSIPTPPSKSSPSDVSTSENLTPVSGGFAQNSYTKPDERVHQRTEQDYQSVKSEHTDSRVINFSPGQASKFSSSTEQIHRGEIPAEHSWVFPGQIQYPVSPLQSWQPENIFRGYYSGLMNPTVYGYWRDQTVSPSSNNPHLSSFPSQYGPSRPSDNYGQYQICHPDGTPLTFATEQYGQFIPTYGWRKVPFQRPGPHSHAAFPHTYQRPSFDYRKGSSSTNYQMGNVMPMRQDHLSYPHQYSIGQSGQDADPVPAFGSFQNLQGLPTEYETQMGKQVAGNPVYHGQYNFY